MNIADLEVVPPNNNNNNNNNNHGGDDNNGDADNEGEEERPAATTGTSEATKTKTIFDYIMEHDWATVQAIIESDPREADRIDVTSGRSPLHMICSFGSSPPHLIQVAAVAAPHQISVNDKVYNDTPLHIVCRNSQKTLSKAKILLHCCTSPDVVLKRNMIGGTCLHSACGHNAMFAVIKQIIETNPAVLKISTFDGIPPIRGLFFSYTQSIPGVLAVGKMLKGREVTEGHFTRFWQKADHLALEFYKLTNACPTTIKTTTTTTGDSNNDNNNNDYVAHGLIHYNAPLNLLKIALKRNVNCVTALDRDGNTPLHLLVERRPYRLKEREAIQATIAAAAAAAANNNNDDGPTEAETEANNANNIAGLANLDGYPPLILAIRNKIPFENGIDVILKADMTVVSRRDPTTGLFPFQLAAAIGGPEALNSTYQLLSALPQQIGF